MYLNQIKVREVLSKQNITLLKVTYDKNINMTIRIPVELKDNPEIKCFILTYQIDTNGYAIPKFIGNKLVGFKKFALPGSNNAPLISYAIAQTNEKSMIVKLAKYTDAKLFDYFNLPKQYDICTVKDVVWSLSDQAEKMTEEHITFSEPNEEEGTFLIDIDDNYNGRDIGRIKFDAYTDNEIHVIISLTIDDLTIAQDFVYDNYDLADMFSRLYKHFIERLRKGETAEDEYPKRVRDFLKICEEFGYDKEIRS